MPYCSSEVASELKDLFGQTRGATEALCKDMETEDYGLQCMEDVSPPKWHLAHTSWFFENFILLPYGGRKEPFDPSFLHFFNSYYETVGSFHPRPRRGCLSRPTVSQVMAYRSYVTEAIDSFLTEPVTDKEILLRLQIGIHHEMQHQELLITDTKYNFYCNPIKPILPATSKIAASAALPLEWKEYPEGTYETGYAGEGFRFDNEIGRHKTYLTPFAVANRPVTNAEYLEFIKDDGYEDVCLWLSDGWDWLKEEKVRAPLYWFNDSGDWQIYTLHGVEDLQPHDPVCHVSYYEADAFARWCGARLPREEEWEVIATTQEVTGHLFEDGYYQPRMHSVDTTYGSVWRWTQSDYRPYPGFKAEDGSLGEYNGKFMSGRYVLRGGSCATPQSHLRATYRNFFGPDKRWQFQGIQLAKDT